MIFLSTGLVFSQCNDSSLEKKIVALEKKVTANPGKAQSVQKEMEKLEAVQQATNADGPIDCRPC